MDHDEEVGTKGPLENLHMISNYDRDTKEQLVCPDALVREDGMECEGFQHT